MFRTMNRTAFAAAVLISASCAVGFPMLLGEPDMQEDIGEIMSTKPVEPVLSDGSFEQQMQQAMAQQLPSEEPVSVEQMPQDGIMNAVPQQVPTEPSTQLQLAQQSQLSENMEPSTVETMQSGKPEPMTMLSDQPSEAMQSNQPQVMAAAQAQDTPMQQPTLCPPASDCPERDQEMPSSSPSVQTASAVETEASQTEDKSIVVMESDDKKDDTFDILTNPSSA